MGLGSLSSRVSPSSTGLDSDSTTNLGAVANRDNHCHANIHLVTVANTLLLLGGNP
jgi:hypothetical protein